ncbi:hypothetical protein CISIN_1g039769mg [Citrus sinensis]|uniref:DUF4371 domain-containing protein n=1 Tax=Citrus sinensis TaxID=2711 RepID=A0A067DTN8_CITSI|nr:hypothetical protein CISIN_1g039769mg [Citrus sinensis]
MNAQSSQQILENRLRLKTSIVATKWLPKQASTFRGHDESVNSLNRGNFIELIKLLATMNEEINKVVLENAPKNAHYEVGDAKFCIIVDEALDESHKEQIAIILRYVDYDSFIRKCLDFKNEIYNVLARYNLLVENLRGQGYDGASNMAGEWKGLQSLFLNDCPYVYYLHCFAHRLQLVLVAISKKVHEAWLFFFFKVASASFNRYSELKSAREKEIIDLIALEELETGTGTNQVRTLQRAGDTRWSSHFTSVILEKMINDGSSRNMLGEAKGTHREMKSFEFVFILLLLNKVLGISDILCQALQRKSLDILNALNYVSSTKRLLQEFRDSGWDDFIRSVVSFCEKYDIIMLDMSDCYMEGTKSSCQRKDYSQHYLLIDRLIHLVLTLPVSTATTERAFSATKLIKTSLRSKMENEFFFLDCMVIYVKREITDTVDSDSVIDDFYNSKP